MRAGRARLTGTIVEDLVYYQTYTSERTVNSHLKGGLDVPLTRTLVQFGATYIDVHERPGFEIDARSQRTEVGATANVEFRAFPKTFVGVLASRTKIDYDQAATYLGTNLSNELNRTLTAQALTARYRATPLTTVTMEIGTEQNRFEFTPLRDSDSIRIVGGVKFEQRALIKGSASFGYRDFTFVSDQNTAYRGAVGAADVYTSLGPTKIGLRADRDIQYSYEIANPIYVQTGALGSITQHLYGSVDAIARFGVAQLDYKNRITDVLPALARTDYMRTFGAGIGYHASRRTRYGFNVDDYRRTSNRVLQQYNGLTMGVSVTYEF
jgi:hypothetical protein